MSTSHPSAQQGIPGNALPGPYPVGEYAVALRARLRSFASVQLVGELVNLRAASPTRVYFELRDSSGAVSCAAWRTDWEALVALTGPISDGMQVVVAGSCEYYPGSATSSPSFSFAVTDLRVAGAGDLLVRIDRLFKTLDAEGLLEPQKRLPRPQLPRSIGVVTGEGGKARHDIVAALSRRGWAGRIVWGFAPVQDRHASTKITRALQDLAALGDVDVIIVARGGGSLADLLCFCDETLCRTVALMSVPVIASVGHHTDRTLLDGVAAVSCSTPTHAAEAAVPLHCAQARVELCRNTERLAGHADRAVLGRALLLARLARAPAEQIARQRGRLEQSLRELRASGRRRLTDESTRSARRLLVLSRKSGVAKIEHERARRALLSTAIGLERIAHTSSRRRELQHLALALAAHDPKRTLERGYALISDDTGRLVTTARDAHDAGVVQIQFSDAAVAAKIEAGQPATAVGDTFARTHAVTNPDVNTHTDTNPRTNS